MVVYMKKSGCLTYILIFIISSVASSMLVGNIDKVTVPNPDNESPEFEDTDSSDDNTYPEITEESTEPEKPEVPDDSASQNISDDNVSAEFSDNVLFKGYYNQLNNDEKEIYDIVYDGILNGEKTFSFKNVEYKAYSEYCERAVFALTYDHPELFWVQCGYSIRHWHELFDTSGDVELNLVHYAYWDYTFDKNKKIKALEAAVSNVTSQAQKIDSDYERIRFVHDYLIKNAIYDHDELNEYYKTSHDASCEYIFSAYGCLVNGKTVCSGYAKAFQLIMQKLGYDCLYVVGDAGEAHAWNCIYIENEGYYIDVTWDDPDYTYDEPKYEYFCITSETLAKTHEVDEEFDVPECNAEKYNYFEYYGYHLDKYDYNEFCEVIKAQKDQHVINARFGSLKELGNAYNDMIEKGIVRKVLGNAFMGEIACSVNEDHYTLTIYK